jgi:subtilisin family serine protease
MTGTIRSGIVAERDPLTGMDVMSAIQRALVAIVVLALAGVPLAADAATSRTAPPRKASAGPSARARFVPGEVVVKFRPEVPRAQAQDVHDRFGAHVAERVRRGAGIERVRLGSGVSVPEAVAGYEADPAVEYAEPNWYRYPFLDPDDLLFDDQWGLKNTAQSHTLGDGIGQSAGTAGADIRAPEAWDVQTGDPSAVVAVIDTGVDTSHLDLAANLWTNPGESGGGMDTDGIDNDDNGCIDDVHGCDFTRDPPSGMEPLYDVDPTYEGYDHGTHVAGTVAASTNNTTGVAGLCGGNGPAPGCAIMVLKVFEQVNDPDFGKFMGGNVEDEIQALDYARHMGADVVNASFGAPSWSRPEREAIARAAADDVLFVAAAGNSSLDNDRASCADFFLMDCAPLYPASYNLPSILSVAASNHHDEFGYGTACATGGSKNACAFSNWGKYSVDVAAPGTDILSTVPGGGTDTFSGTSMAAPHAAGLAGLLASEFPSLSAREIKNVIMNTAERGLPLGSAMHSLVFPGSAARTGPFMVTRARIDAAAALTAPPPTSNAIPSHDGDIPGAVRLRRRATGRVALPGDVNDVYRRRLKAGKKYRVVLAVPPGKDYDLYVWSPGTTEIWQGIWNFSTPKLRARSEGVGKGENERVTFKARTTGVHYFHVSAWFLSKGSYTLRIKCVSC